MRKDNHRLEETREQMLNAVSNTELNLGKVKYITGKTGGIHIKACSLTNGMVPMLIFLVVIIVPGCVSC